MRAFIEGKIANMRAALLRAGRRAPDPAVTSGAGTLAITRLMLVGATSYEGLGRVSYVVTYDIADDDRREDVATVLSGYGPRVQSSVFECDLRSRRDAASLAAKLRELIDPVEDQVRLYPLDDHAVGRVTVIGARMIEERQDFWIVT